MHDIGCADTNIIWQLEIREGKDQPKEIPKEHDNKGKTIGTLLELTDPIHGSGKVLCWIVLFACYRQLLNCKRLVFMHICSDKETQILAEVCEGG